MTAAPSGPPAASTRRGYIDWLRGLAVLDMILWHTLDSWTVPADRSLDLFWYFMVAGGFGAPLFLFLAGVSVALASGSRHRKGLSPWEAAWPMVRRGGWIWVLGILFRVQAYVLSPGSSLEGILKVDILNVMGPAISAAALVWGLTAARPSRFAALVLAAVAIAYATPPVRASSALGLMPDPLEWYLRPSPGRTTFTLFPWAGFVFAGAAAGVLLERARDPASERRLNLGLIGAGAALAAAAYGAAFLPSLFPGSSFWTSSPAFFLLRAGVLVAIVGLAYVWELRPTAGRFSPMRQFGRTSLFIYWIHVEMVYGVLTYAIHKRLPLWQSLMAFAVFTGLMLMASLAKSELARRWRTRGSADGALARGAGVE